MDHINNGPHKLLKKDPTTKIKAKTLKQLKILKDNDAGVSIRSIVSYSGSPLYNLNKYIANILKTYVKDEKQRQ